MIAGASFNWLTFKKPVKCQLFPQASGIRKTNHFIFNLSNTNHKPFLHDQSDCLNFDPPDSYKRAKTAQAMYHLADEVDDRSIKMPPKSQKKKNEAKGMCKLRISLNKLLKT